MKDQLHALEAEAVKNIAQTESTKELQETNVAYLGRKGTLTTVLRGMGKISKEERPAIGELANKVRDAISKAIESKRATLEQAALESQQEAKKIDVTLPGSPVSTGGPHLLTDVIDEIEDFFIGLGFELRDGS